MNAALTDKTIVVLGASNATSMGAATARKLTSAGANLVLSGRKEEPLRAVADEIGARYKTADITHHDELGALADFAFEQFGGLHGAINFAGAEMPGAINDLTPELLRASAELHFVGSTLFIQQMARRMTNGGSIATASSLTALLAPPGLAAYAGAKAGVDHVVRIAAVEYGAANIRVNSIAPGLTESAMTAGYFTVPSIIDAFRNEIPLGRTTSVHDVAAAACWLMSDECFVTGQVVDISGGQSLRRTPTMAEMGLT